MSDPREELLKKISFSDIDVSEYPKIAFICGGDPKPKHDEKSNTHTFPSVRSYISNCLLTGYHKLRFQNAEDVKEWNSYSLYNDLIEFERDIAHICKVIVLFVESAGSIAELGTFSVIPEISQKLIIFVHEDYASSISFISLGALKKIKSESEGSIHYIGWECHNKGAANEHINVATLEPWRQYTCDSIQSVLDAPSRFKRTSAEYIRTKEVLFIHDLISLFKAITEDEIKGYFKTVQHDFKSDLLRKGIFCLEKLGLIRAVTKGNKTYFLAEDEGSKRFLTLPVQVDTARLAMQVHEYYKHSSQLLRRTAIDAMSNGGQNI